MYINTETQAVLPYEVFMAMHSTVSFPPGDFEPPAPYAKILNLPKPECNPRFQQIVQGKVVFKDGSYYRDWDVIEIFSTQEEKDVAIAAYLKIDQETTQ